MTIALFVFLSLPVLFGVYFLNALKNDSPKVIETDHTEIKISQRND